MGFHQYFGEDCEITGVDWKPQKNYPFQFVQGDAINYLKNNWQKFNYIHASPPCQKFSAMTKGRWQDRLEEHPDLIAPTREILITTGKPYDIENVEGAKNELINPTMLCGTMFGLQTQFGSQLRRHRYFELSWGTIPTPACDHKDGSVIGVYGGGQNPSRKKYPATIGVWGNSGGSSNRDGLLGFSTQDRRDAMGIQWMSGKELSQAIPPAYTKYIAQFIQF